MTSAPKTGKQWPKTALIDVRQHTEALKGQMKRDTSMRRRRGCGENKTQQYHQCHPVSSALAAARTATQESVFTATVDVAKIKKIDKLTTGRISIVSSRLRSAYRIIDILITMELPATQHASVLPETHYPCTVMWHHRLFLPNSGATQQIDCQPQLSKHRGVAPLFLAQTRA